MQKGKVYMIISICILVLSIIGSTLALVYYRSDPTYVTLFFDDGIGDYINYENGNPVLDGNLTVGNNYTSGISTEIEFWKTPVAHNMQIYGHIYLEIDTGSSILLSESALKYAVVSNGMVVGEGNFVGYEEDNLVPALLNYELLSTETHFTIYIWLDENSISNYNIEGETLSVIVKCEATSGQLTMEDIAMRNGNFFDFDYTGDVQTVTLSSGTYKLEVWGAQGGSSGSDYLSGYGGYSTGIISLTQSVVLYINVGGQGIKSNNSVTFVFGGYNGGGAANYSAGTGGGATHIAKVPGVLSTLSTNISNILIVAGGGGGTGIFSTNLIGGSGGGYIGVDGGDYSSSWQGGGAGGTQSSSSFGLGGTGGYESSYGHGSGGGGGGYYGGFGGNKRNGGGGGGSGYINNSNLINAVMYCYECTESNDASTKTISTTNVSETAISNYAKIGNGYARITKILS